VVISSVAGADAPLQAVGRAAVHVEDVELDDERLTGQVAHEHLELGRLWFGDDVRLGGRGQLDAGELDDRDIVEPGRAREVLRPDGLGSIEVAGVLLLGLEQLELKLDVGGVVVLAHELHADGGPGLVRGDEL